MPTPTPSPSIGGLLLRAGGIEEPLERLVHLLADDVADEGDEVRRSRHASPPCSSVRVFDWGAYFTIARRSSSAHPTRTSYCEKRAGFARASIRGDLRAQN